MGAVKDMGGRGEGGYIWDRKLKGVGNGWGNVLYSANIGNLSVNVSSTIQCLYKIFYNFVKLIKFTLGVSVSCYANKFVLSS